MSNTEELKQRIDDGVAEVAGLQKQVADLQQQIYEKQVALDQLRGEYDEATRVVGDSTSVAIQAYLARQNELASQRAAAREKLAGMLEVGTIEEIAESLPVDKPRARKVNAQPAE